MSADKILKVSQTQLLQLIEAKDKALMENAALKGDIEFLLEIREKVEHFKDNNSHIGARIAKAYHQGKVLELLGIDPLKFDQLCKKYNLDIPL